MDIAISVHMEFSSKGCKKKHANKPEKLHS